MIYLFNYLIGACIDFAFTFGGGFLLLNYYYHWFNW